MRCEALGELDEDLRRHVKLHFQHRCAFGDEIYRLHIAKAISRPCYMIACYTTIQEARTQSQLRAKRSHEVRKESFLLSTEKIRKISSSLVTLSQADHLQADPLENNFRAVPDCRIHHECNDPMFRSLSLSRMIKDLSKSSSEYKEVWRDLFHISYNIDCSFLVQEYRKIACDTQQFAIKLLE